MLGLSLVDLLEGFEKKPLVLARYEHEVMLVMYEFYTSFNIRHILISLQLKINLGLRWYESVG
jgi:hypothetical protein